MRILLVLGSLLLGLTVAGASNAQDAEADADTEAAAEEDATQDGAGEQDAEEEESELVRPESEQQLGSSACSASARGTDAGGAWLLGAALALALARRKRSETEPRAS